jgi:hypothetical protein
MSSTPAMTDACLLPWINGKSQQWRSSAATMALWWATAWSSLCHSHPRYVDLLWTIPIRLLSWDGNNDITMHLIVAAILTYNVILVVNSSSIVANCCLDGKVVAVLQIFEVIIFRVKSGLQWKNYLPVRKYFICVMQENVLPVDLVWKRIYHFLEKLPSYFSLKFLPAYIWYFPLTWYGHEGGGEAQFQESTKMREARCRLACQDDLRYVIISLRLCQQFLYLFMLFRVPGHVMGHLGFCVCWVWACPSPIVFWPSI